VFEDGGVAISVGGDVTLAGVISQGCTPIGETWTLTRVEQNLIHHIANRPAYAVLAETVSKTSSRRTAQGAAATCSSAWSSTNTSRIFIAGDFLVRNLIGGDPNSGVLAVGACRVRGRPCSFSGATPRRRPRT
jgi:small ligand-binding sensory domain FIST